MNFKHATNVVYPFIHPFTFQIERGVQNFIEKYEISHVEAIIIFLMIVFTVHLLRCFFVKIYQTLFGYQKKSLVALIFSFSITHIFFVRNYFIQEITQISAHFVKDLDQKCENKRFEIPENGLKQKQISETLQRWYKRQEEFTYSGKISGCRYTEDQKLDQLIRREAKNFMYHNPLHSTQFPSTRQMESQVISMTCNLFHNPHAFGVFTAGGTESIALGMLAHRNYYRDFHGITKPNVVMPNTCHVAFNQACHNFNLQIRSIQVDSKTLTVSAKDLAQHIDENTVCLVGSCPNFPYGNYDNIPEYAKLAKSRGIGLHVDCCLGGFLVAFKDHVDGMKDMPDFDFRVDGVTSISCDHHKYGLAPKGSSIVMFKTRELRHAVYFGISNWPGGLYCTPTLLGSRSTAPIAGAWIAMMYNGKAGYIQNAQKIDRAIQIMKKALKEEFSDYFQVMGSQVSCVAFKSKNKKVNIYVLNDVLHKNKGWGLSALQSPPAIHVSMTLKIANNVNELLKDLKDALLELLKNPQQPQGTSVELYGAAVQIPDNAAIEKAMHYIVDGFLGMQRETPKN